MFNLDPCIVMFHICEYITYFMLLWSCETPECYQTSDPSVM